MDHQRDLDDLAELDRLIADADRRLRDLELTTRREPAPDRHAITKANELIAALRLTLVKYKASRAAIVQYIHDTESGRL